jgi:hypothetical protein
LTIRERLATSDPRNTMWQRDLAVSYWKLASLGPAAGSTDDRRAMLRRGLDILIVARFTPIVSSPKLASHDFGKIRGGFPL